jgi:hypothetical protein
MAVLLQPMTAENASGQLPDVQHSPENDEWSRPIGAPQLPNPGAAGSPNCVKGPGPIQTTGSFIYADGGAADLDGNVTCFSAVDSGWKTVTTQYGQFKMQTLAHKWPDGQWWVDNEGRTQLSYNTYEGFRRNSVNDDVDVAACLATDVSEALPTKLVLPRRRLPVGRLPNSRAQVSSSARMSW